MASIFKKNGQGNWIVKWIDVQGRRRERSTKTTCKRTAELIKKEIESRVALHLERIVDPRREQFIEQDARPLQHHIDEYVKDLELRERSPRTVSDAKAHLAWVVQATNARWLSDLTLGRVERALANLLEEGKSARTFNHRGGSARAFMSWCLRKGRISCNPLEDLPKRWVDLDRRRERRAVTQEEIDRLLCVAEQRGQKLW